MPFKNIAAAATTVVDTGEGILHHLVINTALAGTVTIYDNTAASGTKIGVVTLAADTAPTTIRYEAPYATGLTVVTSVATDVTVIYSHTPDVS